VTILGTTAVIYADESKDYSLMSLNPPIASHIPNAKVVYCQKERELIGKFSSWPEIVQTIIILANVATGPAFLAAHQLLHAI
jgi:hypothetical protein